jgi:hypothetical protein
MTAVSHAPSRSSWGAQNTIPLQIEQFAQAAEFIHPTPSDDVGPGGGPNARALQHEPARTEATSKTALERAFRLSPLLPVCD